MRYRNLPRQGSDDIPDLLQYIERMLSINLLREQD